MLIKSDRVKTVTENEMTTKLKRLPLKLEKAKVLGKNETKQNRDNVVGVCLDASQLAKWCIHKLIPASSRRAMDVAISFTWYGINYAETQIKHSGTPKQRDSYQSSPTFLCFESPTTLFASQHNLFRTM